MSATLNCVEDASSSPAALIFPFFCCFVSPQLFQHSCGKYSPDVCKLFVGGWRIPSQKHGASIRPRTNTFSKTWANIRPWTNTSSKTWANIRPWTNSISKTWGEYSSMDEYIIENMGRIFVRGRIVSRKRGANIRPWTNATCSTDGFREYSSKLFVFVRC